MFKQYRASSSSVLDNDYQLEYAGTVNELIPVCKYRSLKTGLRIVIAQVDGPLVNGYFCLATEAHDDDGLPHTLEHLVFLGSEEYPYKGVLDLVANRCLASGTNAWTDTDHTCYTMTTAGTDGFLNLIPVYLDHILYPTLTESGYKTEVHHINGEGEDAGVVYCEMQARENTGESRTHLAMLRAMYPGDCGYRYETGGILNNLRSSTSHEKVKNYHKNYYRPENLYLIVTGMVEPQKVLEQVHIVEKKILSKGSLPVYKRPWLSPVPPLEQTVEKTELYPSDDEENGMVIIAWRGPLAKEQTKLASVMILMEYLTDTAIAPLQREFVELTEPYCNEVRYSIIENSESCVYLHFENVPVEKLKEIKPRLMSVLHKLVTDTDAIDMSRMHTVIHRHVLEAMNNLEDHPHDTVAFHIIGEFLYGDNIQDMELRLNNIATFRQLDKEPQQFWTELINFYLLDKNQVVIIGEPSQKLMEEMSEEERLRIEKQAEVLGDDGLLAMQQSIEQAVAENERPAPDELLTLFDVPDVNSIHFHSISPSNNHPSSQLATNELFPLTDIPVLFELDDIKTNFVMLTVLMNTECIPHDLKPYLPLYLEVILESPVLRDGVVIPHEQVISELAADTLFNSASLGAVGGKRFSCGEFASLATLSLKVELDCYLKGVHWLHDLLYGVQFTTERVHIIANKMLNDVARMKRDGQTVVRTLAQACTYSKDSNHFTASMLRQHKFLSQLVVKLETDSESQLILERLEQVRSLLTKPSNLVVHMAAHVEHLVRQFANSSAVSVWINDFIPSALLAVHADSDRSMLIRKDSEFVITDGNNASGVIVGVGSVESAYLIQMTRCITDFNDPDMAAVMVYMQYLTQLEGPMWKQIRGQGLSYHYRMYMKPETGLLYFILAKSSHLVDAYKEAYKIVNDFLNGSTVFSELELTACKSSLIFNIIEEEETPSHASVQSILSYLRGIEHGYNRKIIQMIPKVTVEDLQRIGPKYLAPLFDPARSKVAICCHPSKVEEICRELQSSVTKELTVIESLDDAFLCDL